MARSYGNTASSVSAAAVKRKLASATGDTGVSGTGPFTKEPVIGQPVGPISRTPTTQPVSGVPSAPSKPTKISTSKAARMKEGLKTNPGLKNAAARRLANLKNAGRGKKSRGMRAI